MSFELKLAIQGNLGEFLKAEADRGARAVTLGIGDTIESGKLFARAQVRQAGMGDKLGNAWRSRRFPSRANVHSLNAAASLFSNAPHIIDIYAKGGTIVPVNGRKYLAIPTRFLPKVSDLIRGQRQTSIVGGTPMVPQRVADRLGVKLRFVPLGNGGGMLVASELRLSRSKKQGRAGTARRASDKMIAKGKSLTLPLFWLVKRAKVAKKLDLAAIESHMAGQLEANVLRRWVAAG